MNSFSDDPNRERVFSVSELTRNVKRLLEQNFPLVWIYGEISNFRIPASGHFYFTLKDRGAQIQSVMFRGQNRRLKFEPEDGMAITGLGRITVYEPRGSYQIILEYMEPKGVGALQVAFERLKARLAEEGLFDESHKTPLPFLPKKISVITSPTGAVIHDVITVVQRRFPNVHIRLSPVKVQGEGAVGEIVSALELVNRLKDSDVIILARGGGSLEDLSAFNSEEVARAVFSSKIPVISAVGHETDFTIADFVADLRAPTPSAAAEMAAPRKRDLARTCDELTDRLENAAFRHLDALRGRLEDTRRKLIDPRKRLDELRLRVDDYTARLVRVFSNNMAHWREQLRWRQGRLHSATPLNQVRYLNEKLKQSHDNLLNSKRIYVDERNAKLRELTARLHALSPLAILERGYSITRTSPGAKVIRDPARVAVGQELEVMVAKGSIFVNVNRTKPEKTAEAVE
ncbi:MAG: exodeoxyribonuclease VII large subunit [Desulfobacterales bacterium]|nr:exodeoxyribonuclease VII large subunit [Desulfobacterales bacterium]